MAAESKDGLITKRQQYEQTRAALELERSSFVSHWSECADFVKPRRYRQFLSDRNKGERRNQKIIDSTATFAHRTLQSGLHAGLSSPARPWFRLSVPDPDLAKFRPVKLWLHDVTQRMLSVFLKSNLYTALPTVYGDMAAFGTAAMAVLADDKELFRCYPYPVNSFALGISDRQTVDTFTRESQMTVRQVVAKYGRVEGSREIDWSKLSKTVKSLWERGQYEAPVDVCWIVAPNPDADAEKLGSKYLPWLSCHFEKGTDEAKLLKESGFNEFPILAPRWDVVAEDIYATEWPASIALGDIKALQIMTKRKAQGVEKMLNPPLQAPVHLKNQKVSLLAGDVTFADMLQQQQGIRPIHEVQMPVNEIRVDIEDVRNIIRRAFYEDLFLMLAMTDRREITATEIEERHEEKLLTLGPVLERSNDELHEPLIDRCYPMLDRAGLIPPPPPDLEGVELKVEYLSLMSQAQKLVGVVGLDRFVRSVAPLVEAYPQAREKLNPYRIIDEYAEAYGVNPELVLPDEEAEAAVQAQREAAMEAQRAETAAVTARGAKDLSQAQAGGRNVLEQIMEGAG